MNSTHLRSVLGLALLGVAPLAPAAGTTTSAPAPTAASKAFAAANALSAERPKDADYTAFDNSRTAPGERPKDADSPEQLRWDFTALDRFLRAGDDYLALHPDSPNRWRVAMRMNGVFAMQAARLVTPAARAAVAGIFDDQALAARAAMLKTLCAVVVASPGPSAEEKLMVELGPINGYAIASALTKSGNWGPWRAELDRLAAAYPDSPVLVGLYDIYLAARQIRAAGVTTADIRDDWAKLTQSPNHAVAKYAAGRVLVLDQTIAHDAGLQAAPIVITFTAADGREVDLAKLRGKVVLVDFWATWCGPCVAELPNVKQVYAAYHDKGFEVIGISLENAKLAPGDNPEQIAAKLAAATKILTDFTTKNAMPWPQYFDGKFWKNDISNKYAISSIPAMFLLDQEGRLVSTNARGPKLEAEVKRLLKL